MGAAVARTAATLTVAALFAAGCQDGRGAAPITDANVRTLLADRAESLVRSAPLRELGLQSWSESLERLDGTGQTARAHVVVHYRFPGDTTDALARSVLDLVATDGEPEVRGVSTVPLVPWDVDGMRAQRGDRAIVVGNAPDPVLRKYTSELDTAIESVETLVPVPETVVAILATDSEQADALVPGPALRIRVAAAATTLEPPGLPPGPVRIVGDMAVLGSLRPAVRGAVLGHETFHVATAGADPVPTWLGEGLADYAGYRGSGVPLDEAVGGLLRQARAGDVPTELPDASAFTDPERATAAYEGAHLAVWLLATEYGVRSVVRLFRYVSAGGTAAVEDGLAAVLGTDLASVTERWRAEVIDRAGG